MPRAIYKEEHQKIVERLKKARLDAGLDQVEVAEKLGKTQSYVSKIESGKGVLMCYNLKNLRNYTKRQSIIF